MRTITVRPVRFEDIEVGATVYAQKHKDFVLEYEVESVKDSIWDREQNIKDQFPAGHTHDYRSAHCKDPYFGSQWGFTLYNTEPGEPLRSMSNPQWYVEVTEPEEGAEPLIRRVIEPEGVTVTVQVFVPNADLELFDPEMAVARAKDITEAAILRGIDRGPAWTPLHLEIDHIAGRLVSENHVHVFDDVGVLLHEDIRTSKMHALGTFGHGILVTDALEVDVKEAQREVIQSLAAERAQKDEVLTSAMQRRSPRRSPR